MAIKQLAAVAALSLAALAAVHSPAMAGGATSDVKEGTCAGYSLCFIVGEDMAPAGVVSVDRVAEIYSGYVSEALGYGVKITSKGIQYMMPGVTEFKVGDRVLYRFF